MNRTKDSRNKEGRKGESRNKEGRKENEGKEESRKKEGRKGESRNKEGRKKMKEGRRGEIRKGGKKMKGRDTRSKAAYLLLVSNSINFTPLLLHTMTIEDLI